MISGGYNIVDFEGIEVPVTTSFTIYPDMLHKVQDETKPLLIGNVNVVTYDGSFYIMPSFFARYKEGDNIMIDTVFAYIRVSNDGQVVILSK